MFVKLKSKRETFKIFGSSWIFCRMMFTHRGFGLLREVGIPIKSGLKGGRRIEREKAQKVQKYPKHPKHRKQS
jgi:hypothetical protein